jgi:hypothetical protein
VRGPSGIVAGSDSTSSFAGGVTHASPASAWAESNDLWTITSTVYVSTGIGIKNLEVIGNNELNSGSPSGFVYVGVGIDTIFNNTAGDGAAIAYQFSPDNLIPARGAATDTNSIFGGAVVQVTSVAANQIWAGSNFSRYTITLDTVYSLYLVMKAVTGGTASFSGARLFRMET